MEYTNSLIVPVYNEAKSVKKVIESILKHKGGATKLILVQDGSQDGTEVILRALQEDGYFTKWGIEFIDFSENQGYGKALVAGFQKALLDKNTRYILTMDCDEQHQPEDLIQFLNADPAVDIVSGSRYLEDLEKGIAAPKDRVQINHKLTEKYKNIAFSSLGESWPLTDSFCGMKRYSRNFLEAFVKETPKFDRPCFGYGFPLLVWGFYLNWLKKTGRKLSESFGEIAIPKIYISDDRSFGENLDFPKKRYRYYLNCMKMSKFE